MHKWCYVYARLRITSNLELPEWEPFLWTETLVQSDVIISLESSEKTKFRSSPAEPIITKSEFQFFIPNVGVYRIVNGAEIFVYPVATAMQNELRLFLLGTAWGALCYQRGMFAVHASAVRVGNEAVLFCATPGKGKSTISAFLAAKGYPLVSDDLCCIELRSQERPVIYSSTQRLRLWKDALVALGLDSEKLERDHFRLDKYILPWNNEKMTESVPLKAIYLLEWGTSDLVRLNGVNALRNFVSAATYRGELLEKMGLSGSYWQSCLELMQVVPVWKLSRPRDFAFMKDSVSKLELHFA